MTGIGFESCAELREVALVRVGVSVIWIGAVHKLQWLESHLYIWINI